MMPIKRLQALQKIVLTGILLLLAMPAFAAEEDAIKAGFVLNFAKYAQWPKDHAMAKFTVCAFDFQPLAGALNELQGRLVQGKTIRLLTGVRQEQLKNCQVLYVANNDEAKLAQYATTLMQYRILTVGESATFLSEGGMISLKQRNGRFRFDINLHLVQAAGLNLSSQLLKLADTVIQ